MLRAWPIRFWQKCQCFKHITYSISPGLQLLCQCISQGMQLFIACVPLCAGIFTTISMKYSIDAWLLHLTTTIIETYKIIKNAQNWSANTCSPSDTKCLQSNLLTMSVTWFCFHIVFLLIYTAILLPFTVISFTYSH